MTCRERIPTDYTVFLKCSFQICVLLACFLFANHSHQQSRGVPGGVAAYPGAFRGSPLPKPRHLPCSPRTSRWSSGARTLDVRDAGFGVVLLNESLLPLYRQPIGTVQTSRHRPKGPTEPVRPARVWAARCSEKDSKLNGQTVQVGQSKLKI